MTDGTNEQGEKEEERKIERSLRGRCHRGEQECMRDIERISNNKNFIHGCIDFRMHFVSEKQFDFNHFSKTVGNFKLYKITTIL